MLLCVNFVVLLFRVISWFVSGCGLRDGPLEEPDLLLRGVGERSGEDAIEQDRLLSPYTYWLLPSSSLEIVLFFLL